MLRQLPRLVTEHTIVDASDTALASGVSALIGGVGSSGAPPSDADFVAELDRIDGEVDAKRAAYPPCIRPTDAKSSKVA